ncbi:MAG TPA: ATP-binding protein, partial [Nakamurella sp.]
VDSVPAVANAVGTVAAGGGPLAQPAVLLLHPTVAMTGESGNGLLQYAFSLLNLVLGMLLIIRRPRDLVPRLLALGLLGTAATFNLPSHEAFHILGSPWPIALLHFTFHIVSGVAYLWAVVLFPDGRLPERIAVSGRALTASVIVVTVMVSVICWWSDFLLHPQFFVIFFGILIPVAGVGAQTLRLADAASTPTTRRSARLLIGALLPALALALIWCCARGVAALGISASDAAAEGADRLQDLFPLVFAIVPVVLFAGVLRYRLFDIDRLLSRVLVYVLLVIGSGLVYSIAVVTGGALVGGASWWTVLVLAVAAVALEPAWVLAQRWANRVVFGQDLGPAAAMRTLISGLEQVTPTSELAQLVEVSVRATRAIGAQLWLRDDAGWSLGAAAPHGGQEGTDPTTVDPGGIHRLRAAARIGPKGAGPVLRPGQHWAVVHLDEELGVLTVDLADSEALPGREQELLADLASHAGLLVHNAVLARQLADRVGALSERARQLATSRRRLVTAQDKERRRVERDLHDGAQQTLVAVMLGTRMAVSPGATPEAGSSILHELHRELDASRSELTEISGGQLPRALREGGLAAGLEHAAEAARRSGLTVTLRVDLPTGAAAVPIDADVAATVYYCCSEALQNVLKYAAASRVGIQAGVEDGSITFTVTDDGAGLDATRSPDASGGLRGLDDRASLQGGWIAIDSSPGGGTRLRGAIPLSAVEAGSSAPVGGGGSVASSGSPAIELATQGGVRS